MIEHLVELRSVGARFSIPESEVSVNPKPSGVMVGIVGTVENVFFDCAKMGFDNV